MAEERQQNFLEITEVIHLPPAGDILSKMVKMDTEKVTWTLVLLLRCKGYENKRQENNLMFFNRTGQTPRAI